MVDEALYFFEKDVGKKVYEIEYEATYVTKWQVLANDENEAFNTWLEGNKQDLVTQRVELLVENMGGGVFSKGEGQKGLYKEIEEEYNEISNGLYGGAYN